MAQAFPTSAPARAKKKFSLNTTRYFEQRGYGATNNGRRDFTIVLYCERAATTVGPHLLPPNASAFSNP